MKFNSQDLSKAIVFKAKFQKEGEFILYADGHFDGGYGCVITKNELRMANKSHDPPSDFLSFVKSKGWVISSGVKSDSLEKIV